MHHNAVFAAMVDTKNIHGFVLLLQGNDFIRQPVEYSRDFLGHGGAVNPGCHPCIPV